MTTTIEKTEVIPQVSQDEGKNKRKRKFSRVKNVRSAYNLFYIDMKKKAGEEKIKSADVSVAWKEQEDKSYWQELAKKEKKRFLDDALAAGYTLEEIEERKGSKSKKKSKKNEGEDNNTIKRPCNASLKYTNDHIKVVRETPRGIIPHELDLVLDYRWKKHVKTQKKKDENYEPDEGEEETFKKEEASKKVEISPTEARVILGFRWKDMEDTDEVKVKYLKEAKDRYDEWVKAKEEAKKESKKE